MSNNFRKCVCCSQAGKMAVLKKIYQLLTKASLLRILLKNRQMYRKFKKKGSKSSSASYEVSPPPPPCAPLPGTGIWDHKSILFGATDANCCCQSSDNGTCLALFNLSFGISLAILPLTGRLKKSISLTFFRRNSHFTLGKGI